MRSQLRVFLPRNEQALNGTTKCKTDELFKMLVGLFEIWKAAKLLFGHGGDAKTTFDEKQIPRGGSMVQNCQLN